MITLRLVQLASGKFAVQKQERLWGVWNFCEAKDPYKPTEYRRILHSGSPELVMKYCVVDTESDCYYARIL